MSKGRSVGLYQSNFNPINNNNYPDGQAYPNGNPSDRKSILDAKKAANAADASKPALTPQEVTELANLS